MESIKLQHFNKKTPRSPKDFGVFVIYKYEYI